MMETGTTIIQKKLPVKLTFRFGEDQLTRTLTDDTGESEFSVFYEAIDVENPSAITFNKSRRYQKIIGVLVIALAASILLSHINKMAAGLLFLLLVPLTVFVLIGKSFGLFATKYTILKIPGRPNNNIVKIMHDRNHDVIFREIKERWARRLRKLLGTVDAANDPDKELEKFKWLKEHGVISELEYQDAAAKLRAAKEWAAGENSKEAMQSKIYVN